MIQFNELKITSDNLHIYIDAQVKSNAYYTNVGIKNLIIDTSSTFTETGPSSNYIYMLDIESIRSSATIYLVSNETTPIQDGTNGIILYVNAQNVVKRVIVTIPSSTLTGTPSLTTTLFFVYATALGTPSSDTPCGLDNLLTLQALYNKSLIYDAGLAYTREICNSCSINENFIDFILKLKGLELALVTKHYTAAISMWNKFFSATTSSTSYSTSNCNCQ